MAPGPKVRGPGPGVPGGPWSLITKFQKGFHLYINHYDYVSKKQVLLHTKTYLSYQWGDII